MLSPVCSPPRAPLNTFTIRLVPLAGSLRIPPKAGGRRLAYVFVFGCSLSWRCVFEARLKSSKALCVSWAFVGFSPGHSRQFRCVPYRRKGQWRRPLRARLKLPVVSVVALICCDLHFIVFCCVVCSLFCFYFQGAASLCFALCSVVLHCFVLCCVALLDFEFH